MHLVIPCDSLVTFSSGSEAMLLFPRTERHNINVSTLHAEVLVAWRAGGHILRNGLTIWPPWLRCSMGVHPEEQCAHPPDLADPWKASSAQYRVYMC